MICRLCLSELINGINILSDGDETTVSKTIVKYFNIDVQPDDGVSNQICSSCWQQIDDFHRFWLDINEKQKTLQTHLEIIGTKLNIADIETFQAYADVAINSPNDDKDCGGLREPQIDLPLTYDDACEDNRTEFDAAALDNDQHDSSTDQEDLAPPSPLLQSKKEQLKIAKTQKSVIQTEERPKRKYIKRTLKPKSDEGISASKKADAASQRMAKLALIAEMDEYIAANSELSCCLCKETLNDFVSLRKHFRQKHKCEGYMTCCNNRFVKRHLWVDHLKMHREPEFLKCHICNKKLASRNTYQNHMDTKHPDANELQFFCKLCPRKFVKQYLLDYHMKSKHTTTRDHICKTCNKGFVSAGVLKKHERNIHLNAYESVCEICGKCFKAAHNLARHVDAIHSEAPRTRAQCHICKKWLKNAYTLKKHIIAHSEEPSGKEYPCSKCGCIKNSRQSLAAHIRYYHSDKSFKCLVCSREFKMPIALREHEARHAGIHLYTCKICAKKFRSIRNMRKHMAKHSNEAVNQQRSDTVPQPPNSSTSDNTIVLPIQTQKPTDLDQGLLKSLPCNQPHNA